MPNLAINRPPAALVVVWIVVVWVVIAGPVEVELAVASAATVSVHLVSNSL
jgi:hypothetical protein